MTRLQAVGAGALVLALGAAGCGGGGGSGNSSSSGDAQAKNTSGAAATVGLRAVPTLGKVLVDGRGRTLYLFEKDTGDKSSCSGRRSQRAASRAPERASGPPCSAPPSARTARPR